MYKQLNESSKIVERIKQNVITDIESVLSDDLNRKLENNEKFQADKNNIFKEVPGNKYFSLYKQSRNRTIFIKWVAGGFFILFSILYVLLVYLGENFENDAALFFSFSISAAFLYFSLTYTITASDYEKFVYGFFYDKYEELLISTLKVDNSSKEIAASNISEDADLKLISNIIKDQSADLLETLDGDLKQKIDNESVNQKLK